MKKNKFWSGFKTYAVWAFALTGIGYTIKTAYDFYKKKQATPKP